MKVKAVYELLAERFAERRDLLSQLRKLGFEAVEAVAGRRQRRLVVRRRRG
jgi:hypothetical protein